MHISMIGTLRAILPLFYYSECYCTRSIKFYDAKLPKHFNTIWILLPPPPTLPLYYQTFQFTHTKLWCAPPPKCCLPFCFVTVVVVFGVVVVVIIIIIRAKGNNDKYRPLFQRTTFPVVLSYVRLARNPRWQRG